MVVRSIAERELRNGATIRFKKKEYKVKGEIEEIEKKFPDFELKYCNFFMKVQ